MKNNSISVNILTACLNAYAYAAYETGLLITVFSINHDKKSLWPPLTSFSDFGTLFIVKLARQNELLAISVVSSPNK